MHARAFLRDLDKPFTARAPRSTRRPAVRLGALIEKFVDLTTRRLAAVLAD